MVRQSGMSKDAERGYVRYPLIGYPYRIVTNIVGRFVSYRIRIVTFVTIQRDEDEHFHRGYFPADLDCEQTFSRRA